LVDRTTNPTTPIVHRCINCYYPLHPTEHYCPECDEMPD